MSEQSLAKAHDKIKLMREAGIKIIKKDPIQKAKENPESLRLAINAKCWECIGAGHDPNPRAEIKNCLCVDCPLYPLRPYQKIKN